MSRVDLYKGWRWGWDWRSLSDLAAHAATAARERRQPRLAVTVHAQSITCEVVL